MLEYIWSIYDTIHFWSVIIENEPNHSTKHHISVCLLTFGEFLFHISLRLVDISLDDSVHDFFVGEFAFDIVVAKGGRRPGLFVRNAVKIPGVGLAGNQFRIWTSSQQLKGGQCPLEYRELPSHLPFCLGFIQKPGSSGDAVAASFMSIEYQAVLPTK